MTLKTATNIAIAGTILWITSLLTSYAVSFIPSLGALVYSSDIAPVIIYSIGLPFPVTYLIFFIVFKRNLPRESSTINNLPNHH